MRFIPARAGNTREACGGGAKVAVHPRTRGEHAGFGGFAATCCGSSPHARGTHRAEVGAIEYRRFIPARAGNTR